MQVLFATCHDPDPLADISKQNGKVLSFKTTAAGGVTWEEADDASLTGSGATATPKLNLKITVPNWCGKWVVSMSEYAENIVGAKSKNLAALRGQLPDWISLPGSVTLPFGCFEEALDAKENADVKKRLLAAAKQVTDGPAVALQQCRCAYQCSCSSPYISQVTPKIVYFDCRNQYLQDKSILKTINVRSIKAYSLPRLRQ